MPVYQHANGNLYQRLDECGISLGPGQEVAYWIPDEEAPAGRGAAVVLYVPEGGQMPDELAAQGYGAYATPLSRWDRRFKDVSPSMSTTLENIHAFLSEGWTEGPCEIEGCEEQRCKPFVMCWGHVKEMQS